MGILHEVRIGNLYLDHGRIADVDHNFFIENKDEYAKPIELTEEWLLRFGFKEEINSEFVKFWNKEQFILYHEYYHKTPVIIFNAGNELQNKIIHVHQLQNLFFALTGEELFLKEKVGNEP